MGREYGVARTCVYKTGDPVGTEPGCTFLAAITICQDHRYLPGTQHPDGERDGEKSQCAASHVPDGYRVTRVLGSGSSRWNDGVAHGGRSGDGHGDERRKDAAERSPWMRARGAALRGPGSVEVPRRRRDWSLCPGLDTGHRIAERSGAGRAGWGNEMGIRRGRLVGGKGRNPLSMPSIGEGGGPRFPLRSHRRLEPQSRSLLKRRCRLCPRLI